MRYYLSVIFTLILFAVSLPSYAQTERDTLPHQTGIVNDFEDVLTDTEEDTLTNIIAHHHELTNDHIIIVTVKDLPKPYTSLYQYTLDLANYWSDNDTVRGYITLIAVSVNLRSVRIQVNRELQVHIDNKEIKEIIDEHMVPNFLKEQYYDGIRLGTRSMIERMNKIKRVRPAAPTIDFSK